MTTRPKVESLVAINKANVELEFLGTLLWFTITDMAVTRQQLQDAFARSGVDTAHLPRPINHRDAFRRATSNAEMKRQPVDGGRYLNLMVREVRMDPQRIVRQLVREVVDAENVRLEYLPVANLVLQGEAYSFQQLAPMSALEQTLAAKIGNDYADERVRYNGRHVRDVVMGVLHTCGPVAVRPSGGVYFVPREHEGSVNALKALVDELAGYTVTSGRSRLWTVPVVDTEEQREMVQASLEDQVEQESKSLIEEMHKVLGGARTVTQALVKQYVERARALADLVGQYEAMLDGEVTAARANLDLARRQAAAMLDKVEV